MYRKLTFYCCCRLLEPKAGIRTSVYSIDALFTAAGSFEPDKTISWLSEWT